MHLKRLSGIVDVVSIKRAIETFRQKLKGSWRSV